MIAAVPTISSSSRSVVTLAVTRPARRASRARPLELASSATLPRLAASRLPVAVIASSTNFASTARRDRPSARGGLAATTTSPLSRSMRALPFTRGFMSSDHSPRSRRSVPRSGVQPAAASSGAAGSARIRPAVESRPFSQTRRWIASSPSNPRTVASPSATRSGAISSRAGAASASAYSPRFSRRAIDPRQLRAPSHSPSTRATASMPSAVTARSIARCAPGASSPFARSVSIARSLAQRSFAPRTSNATVGRPALPPLPPMVACPASCPAARGSSCARLRASTSSASESPGRP